MAFLLGLIASRLKLPVILGYLCAGLLLGPFTPGFVADAGIARELAEIGVSLLMFGVGLHFSIKDLLAVRKIAIPGAVAQIIVATALGAGLASFWGWSFGAGIVFGLSLSVASTVVLLRALGDRRQLETVNGRIAVGWLIVEDLVTVVALVALPVLSTVLGGRAVDGAADDNITVTLLTTLAKISSFVVVMLVLGKRLIPSLLGRVARTGSRELFTLGVVATALGIAFGAAALFGVSPALGAFFAGVVISESDLSYQAGAELLPLQETFAVLFFVSVGMVFNPQVLVEQPVPVLLALAIVLVGKSVAALVIVLLFRYPFATALTISASLAQIGEFSFILVGLGTSLEILPAEVFSIVIAAAVVSIAANPLIFSTISPIDRCVRARPRLLAMFEGSNREPDVEQPSEELQDHVVMVGFGRVGSMIASALRQQEVDYVVIDQDRSIVEELAKNGETVIFGDATRPGILEHAGLRHARMLIIATQAGSRPSEIVRCAQQLNPAVRVCVRTHSFKDAVFFQEQGIERVVMGELELALQVAEYALRAYDRDADSVEATIQGLRTSI